MLRMLRIRDLAIIEELELTLEPGLNVITGETGAGKSILLQALDVVLGGRADAELVRTGADEAVVEAVFTDIPAPVRSLLAEAGLSEGEELLLRRVVSSAGRTRAYVNSGLGSLAVLRDIAPHLVRAYGQDEHQALRRVESHRELLDAAGALGNTLAEMRERHARMNAAREAADAARRAQEARQSQLGSLVEESNELNQASLKRGEGEQLTAERTRLMHAERLAGMIGEAEQTVYGDDEAASALLGRAIARLKEAERFDRGIEPMRRLLEGSLAELEEVGASLGRHLRTLAPDAERLETIEQRLALVARLTRKYGKTVEELVARRDEVAAELAASGAGDGDIGPLEAAAETARRAAAEWAGRLSVERRRVARDLTRTLLPELQALALEGAIFTVQFAEGERPIGPDGRDEVEFYISTNPGEEPRALARVASGGELSRIMLALKSLAPRGDETASLLFDEVDAGIGGSVAEVIGRKLRNLGRTRQVLCITHLPLIAACADHHVAVMKRQQDGRTISYARPLSNTERVAELARMLGGTARTPEVREHAEQLLRQVAASRGAGAQI
jgi:DNA repair protein RecN (Recombination protein N)